MRVISTTDGPRYIGPRQNAEHVVNTADIYEPAPEGSMQYLDEPAEPVHVLSGAGWAAAFEDGHREELVFWGVQDDGEVFGVTLNDEGRADLASVEDRAGFVRYERINDKENH